MNEDGRGKHPNSLKNLTPGNPGNKGGGSRPKRDKVAQYVLNSEVIIPDDLYQELSKTYPLLDKTQTVEFIMTVQQAKKAMESGDSRAYELLLDSAYGKANQLTEEVSKAEPITIEIIDSASKNIEKIDKD